MLEKINETIGEMDKKLTSRIDAMERKFKSLFIKKRSVLDVQLSNRIEEVEKDLKEMKESKPDAATSRNDEDDEANSRAPVSFLFKCIILRLMF